MKNLESKIMWVVGAAERLATLGIFGGDVPFRITPQGLDEYLMLDEYRDYLFESDIEVVEVFKNIVLDTIDEDDFDKEDFDQMVYLLLEYKNNRTELVKYALSHASV